MILPLANRVASFLESALDSIKRNLSHECHRALIKVRLIYIKFRGTPRPIPPRQAQPYTLTQLRNGPIIYVNEKNPRPSVFLRRHSRQREPPTQVIYTTQLAPEVAVIQRKRQCHRRSMRPDTQPQVLLVSSLVG